MNNVCPVCLSQTFPWQVKNFQFYRCPGCGLIYQAKTTKSSFTPNLGSWGENDPRLQEITYQMKKRTFEILFREIKKFQNQGLLVDIGTGTGALLEVAQKNGFSAIGLEPEEKFARKSSQKGFKILFTSLEKAKIPVHSADVVTFYDVFEHLPEPAKALDKVHQLLRAKGIVVIATPNIQSLSFRIFGRTWPHFKKEHLFYYSPRSLAELLEKNSFKVLTSQSLPKALNFQYAQGYFTAFPTPILSSLVSLADKSLPKFWKNWSVYLPTGNMLVIARKQ